jgi:DNA polymerase I
VAIVLDALLTQLECSELVFVDTEYNAQEVVCLCSYEWRSGRRLALWRENLWSSTAPPYSTGPDTLFCCYAGNAELGTHIRLGWSLPARVLDLNAEFRIVANGHKLSAGFKLIGALSYYGLATISATHKDTMRDRVLAGAPFTEQEKREILEYCMGDVDALVSLLPRILADAAALPWPPNK